MTPIFRLVYKDREAVPPKFPPGQLGGFFHFWRTILGTRIVSEKQTKLSTGKGGARPGAGRPKGSLDKGNALIREMACAALDKVGGIEYLARVAESHPGPFLSLLGKILPVQVGGIDGQAIQHGITLNIIGVPPAK